MGNYKCVVTLAQYTPMLHFQWQEDGVCLRASEVKPKLDRYVLHFLAQQGINPKNLPPDWSDYDNEKTETSHVALRYKMRFSAVRTDVKSDEKYKIHPLYFGALGENKDRIKEVWCRDLSMTLVCLSESKINLPEQGKEATLMDILKTLLPTFFATHCFGTRSNKGFGSFGVVSIGDVKMNGSPADNLIGLLPPDCERAFYMTYKIPVTDGYRMLDNVYVISSLMKGGVNNPRESVYFKSQLRQYTLKLNPNIGSEKAFIKSKVFNDYDKAKYNECCTHIRDSQYQHYNFYRALLGLTERYSYRVFQNQNCVFSKAIRVKHEVGNDGVKIERFPNPIVFKPDRNGMLVMAYSIPQKLRDAEFKFGNNNRTLKPPHSFDLVAFVRECLNAYVDTNSAAKWQNWNEVKKASIWGRKGSCYLHCMDNINRIIEFSEKADGGE